MMNTVISRTQLPLAPQQKQILILIAKGYSNEEIAAKIFVSLSTVKSHNQNLFQKLDVKRRIQAVEKARSLNLIPYNSYLGMNRNKALEK